MRYMIHKHSKFSCVTLIEDQDEALFTGTTEECIQWVADHE